MSKTPMGLGCPPSHDYFVDAVNHIDKAASSSTIAVSAAKGLVYSLVETLGTMIGDPDLPSHVRLGYEGALELAHQLEAKITALGQRSG